MISRNIFLVMQNFSILYSVRNLLSHFFEKKFREINTFTGKNTKTLIWKIICFSDIFLHCDVRGNYCSFHIVDKYCIDMWSRRSRNFTKNCYFEIIFFCKFSMPKTLQHSLLWWCFHASFSGLLCNVNKPHSIYPILVNNHWLWGHVFI